MSTGSSAWSSSFNSAGKADCTFASSSSPMAPWTMASQSPCDHRAACCVRDPQELAPCSG
eukprot:3277176-Alexandrium_andersonii.AAC.1